MSLVSQVLGELMSARAGTGTPVPYDELPITQGVASLISDSLAAMPLSALGPDGRTMSGEVPFAVLDRPDPDEDRADTVHKIAQSLFWNGNAYGLKNRSGDAFTVLNPDTVGYVPATYNDLKVGAWVVNGQQMSRDRLVHWKLNDDPRHGPLGRSPLQKCGTALDTYGWAYRYLGDFFAGGGNPGSVLKSKIELDPSKVTELAEEWILARKQARPAMLPSWLDLTIPPTSGELAQVIEVLSFAAAEVARMLNLPVSLVNAPVAGYSLQYSNVSDEFRRWLAVSLGTTWVARIERGFTSLLPAGYTATLDPSALYRPDLFPDETPPAAQPAPESVTL